MIRQRIATRNKTKKCQEINKKKQIYIHVNIMI